MRSSRVLHCVGFSRASFAVLARECRRVWDGSPVIREVTVGVTARGGRDTLRYPTFMTRATSTIPGSLLVYTGAAVPVSLHVSQYHLLIRILGYKDQRATTSKGSRFSIRHQCPLSLHHSTVAVTLYLFPMELPKPLGDRLGPCQVIPQLTFFPFLLFSRYRLRPGLQIING